MEPVAALAGAALPGNAFRERDARVWLPLGWVLLVLLFFSLSPGKRGVYVLPALPALAIASLPFIEAVLARPGVRRAGLILAGCFFSAAAVVAVAHAVGAKFAVELLTSANLPNAAPLYLFMVLCGAGLAVALHSPTARRLARGAGLARHSFLFPHCAGHESRQIGQRIRAHGARACEGRRRTRAGRIQGAVPAVSRSSDREFWPSSLAGRVRTSRTTHQPGSTTRLIACCWCPRTNGDPVSPRICMFAGSSSGEEWYLVRGPALEECAKQGEVRRAIHYAYKRALIRSALCPLRATRARNSNGAWT